MAVKLLFAQIYIACVIRSGFFPLDLPHLPSRELLFYVAPNGSGLQMYK